MTCVIESSVNEEKSLKTFYGSSNDAKPTTGVADGSVYVETDTLYVYMFDEENETWRQIA